MRIDLKRCRERMVREQLEASGVTNRAVLDAMRKIPRHLFVEEALAAQAYQDHSLPIGHGQTISQPRTVGLMTQALRIEPGMKTLEIGTGSGYQAAVLAEAGAEVFTVERIKPLYLAARERLFGMRYFRIRFKLDDGTLGWPDEGPFDRIIVTAGGPFAPPPLVGQLADQGRMVIPVGPSKRSQKLLVVTKQDGRISEEELGDVAFVDLVGAHGWGAAQ